MENAVKETTTGQSIDGQLYGLEQRAVFPAGRLIGRDQVKRCGDVVGAVILLLFFMPFFAVISVVLFVCYGGGVFYRHERIGRGGVPFHCLKFRTMHIDSQRILARTLKKDAKARLEWDRTQKLLHDPRVHLMGMLLRKSSLDELPQLFNVLRGEMSLVGPRPIIAEERERYDRNFAFYLALRPGITGLWQVSGRNNTTYEERVALDVEYFHKRSTLLDGRILLRTIRVVFTGHGAC